MSKLETAQRRRWVNVVVIFVGLFILAWAIWGAVGGPVSNMQGWWAALVAAGLAAVAAPFVALRSKVLARLAVAVGGAIPLIGAFITGALTIEGLIALILPGIALLAVAPFMGPLPTLQDERRLRQRMR